MNIVNLCNSEIDRLVNNSVRNERKGEVEGDVEDFEGLFTNIGNENENKQSQGD